MGGRSILIGLGLAVLSARGDTAPDAGEGPGVIVANEGGIALYHDAPSGELLAVRPTPSELSLPAGGMVTLITEQIDTFVDVPSRARIQLRGPPPSAAEPLQSLLIDVPGSPDGKPISIWSGCSSAMGPGVHTLPTTSECVAADDTAEPWIVSYEGGRGHYVHVDDIPIGHASSPPRPVTLGPWVAFPSEAASVTTSGIPVGYSPSLTTYSLRGALPLYNLTSSFVASSNAAGVSESAFVAINFEAWLPATVDRIRVTFEEESSGRRWEIWLPPDRQELPLPDIPAEFLPMLPNPNLVEVRAEDRDSISSWSHVLDGGAGEIDFAASPWEWPDLGRYSNRWFVP